MLWPLCIHCRRECRPGGHIPDTCLKWVALERDWRVARGLQ